MKKLSWTLFASLFIFAISAGVQADELGLPYGISDLTVTGTDGCHFDGGIADLDLSDDEVPKLAPAKISMGGDDCTVFEIWVGPLDGSEAVLIPRAEIFEWQQCRFSNVMTQTKLDEYALAYAEDDEETVMFLGVCGEIDGDDDPAPDQDGTFVPTGYAVRVLQVDTN